MSTDRKRFELEMRLRGKVDQDPTFFNSPQHPNQCDGCGQVFDYPIHDHFCYRSCSIACDEIINDTWYNQNSKS